MKIAIYSLAFAPAIGGIETVVTLLAKEFSRLGHSITVITQTKQTGVEAFPFNIIRSPTILEVSRIIQWCDIYIQNNVSAYHAIPLIGCSKPWVVIHHSITPEGNGIYEMKRRIKLFLQRYAHSIAVSTYIGNAVGPDAVVIHNPYDDKTFVEDTNVCRDRELIFVGRLAKEKGVDLLLNAMANMKKLGLTPHLTIVGIGPEEGCLMTEAEKVGVHRQVKFVGPQTGNNLAALLNQHLIMIVPSRWLEPFGVVALEGIACGCVVVGSQGGGLKEAIGPCGVTFPNGDVLALTQCLSKLLTEDRSGLSKYRENAKEHLGKHGIENVAKSYLLFLEAILSGGNSSSKWH